MAVDVVAANFTMYPSLKGVTEERVQKDIVKKISLNLPITVTANTVEFEFYWEEVCKAKIRNCK
jgi:hypothetical protein